MKHQHDAADIERHGREELDVPRPLTGTSGEAVMVTGPASASASVISAP